MSEPLNIFALKIGGFELFRETLRDEIAIKRFYILVCCNNTDYQYDNITYVRRLRLMKITVRGGPITAAHTECL